MTRSAASELAVPVGLSLFSLGTAFGLVVVHAGLQWRRGWREPRSAR